MVASKSPHSKCSVADATSASGSTDELGTSRPRSSHQTEGVPASKSDGALECINKVNKVFDIVLLHKNAELQGNSTHQPVKYCYGRCRVMHFMILTRKT